MTPFSSYPSASLRGVLHGHRSRLCDYCYALVYMWEPLYRTAVLELDGRVVLCAADPQTGAPFCEIPYRGEDLVKTVDTLLSAAPCGANAGELLLCSVDREALATLQEAYGDRLSWESDEEESDYLYDLAALATLRGRPYAAKRNHVHAFLREHPAYVYEPLTADNLAAVRAFYLDYRARYEDDTPTAHAEGDAAACALRDFLSLHMEGGVLREKEKILGFWIGEVVGDTLFVHIEKADASVRGAYPLLVRETAAAYAARGLLYENREEDDGDQGLRQSKRSWCPLALLTKHRVRIRCAGSTPTKGEIK